MDVQYQLKEDMKALLKRYGLELNTFEMKTSPIRGTVHIELQAQDTDPAEKQPPGKI